jgi:hypothetical protein
MSLFMSVPALLFCFQCLLLSLIMFLVVAMLYYDYVLYFRLVLVMRGIHSNVLNEHRPLIGMSACTNIVYSMTYF